MFHENIAKFLRTAFFVKHLRWLLLNKVKTNYRAHDLFCYLTDYTILLSLLRHGIQKIVQNYKDTETETQTTKTYKDENLVLPKE